VNGNKGFETPNWVPLETKLRETGRPIGLCAAFMWMWRDRGIEFYKHIDTRRYLLLDSQCRCWRQRGLELELADFENEFCRVTEVDMANTENRGAVASPKAGRWVGDISAERVNNLWRPEDHEAVIHNLRAADRLTTQVAAFAARKAVEQFQKVSPGRMTMEANPKLNIRGLRLPPPTVKRLGESGIFARPEVSLEYQSLTKRYVVRGVESGGAVAELGRYVTFAGDGGEQISWLQPIDSLAVNGVHAVVVAPVFTRVEMFRMGRTYELVITKHRPSAVQNGNRPKLLAEEVFRGANGYLGLELWGKDKALAGTVLPQFFTRAGEEIEIPAAFVSAAKALTAAVNSIGCTSSCYLTAPAVAATEATHGMVDCAEGSAPEMATTAV
jgi:hypothetical protein